MPDPTLIEIAWQLRGPLGRTVECTIHASAAGVLVQVGPQGAPASRVCLVPTVGRARRKAEEWRTSLLGLREFVEIDA
jgi:hypothetical protein